MIFTDLRHYVATLEKLGQLKVIEGASCELEIGAITEMATSQANSPAVLFDSIQGHKKGYRVLTNFLAHKTRERLVYGVDENLSARICRPGKAIVLPHPCSRTLLPARNRSVRRREFTSARSGRRARRRRAAGNAATRHCSCIRWPSVDCRATERAPVSSAG